MAHIFFFGGFRQASLPVGTGALAALAKCDRPSTNVSINLWRGNTLDAISARWSRATRWLRNLNEAAVTERIVIAGYSMGAHLAVRFAAELIERQRSRAIDNVFLFAPDPKFRECALDAHCKSNGDTSAFGEAQQFWQTDGIPGAEFAAKLRFVGTEIGHGRIFATYSADDEVAEWSDNVKRLLDESAPLPGTFVAVTIGDIANIGDRLQTRLDPAAAASETWIHEQLFENVTARPPK